LPNRREEKDLLERAKQGDREAVGGLLDQHRSRLRRMVVVRMDPRLGARVDPSDVIQETFVVAVDRLGDYLAQPSLPFYVWLRQIALGRLIDLHRRHLVAKRRNIDREEPLELPDASAAELAGQLAASAVEPLRRILREEVRARIHATIARLGRTDREILVLRHLEELDLSHCAAVLGISEEAVRKRYLRALAHIGRMLQEPGSGERP